MYSLFHMASMRRARAIRELIMKSSEIVRPTWTLRCGKRWLGLEQAIRE